MKQVQWKPLLINLAISLGAGMISWLLTMGNMKQYEGMVKPPLSPPAWLFPIVWTILFILMGVAAYLVTISNHEEKNDALLFYGIQLIVNVIWPVIFFNFRMYWLAFLWLLLLWYLIYITIQKFKEIDPRAEKLMIPYLVWVTFAGYLNGAIALFS